jgi:hypothetical protein
MVGEIDADDLGQCPSSQALGFAEIPVFLPECLH